MGEFLKGMESCIGKSGENLSSRLIKVRLRSHTESYTKGPVINSSRGGGGRHLGGTKILHAQRPGG